MSSVSVSRRFRAVSCLSVLLLAAAASPARAQSLTAGSLSGVVTDNAGSRVPEAGIQLIDLATGVRHLATTARNGTFRFALLLPGDYDLLVERIGYNPRLVRNLPVRAGGHLPLSVVLAGGGGVVSSVDTLDFGGAPAAIAQQSLQRASTGDFAALADPSGLITGAGSLFSLADTSLGAAGLPGRLGSLIIDGVGRTGPRHPRLPDAQLEGQAFPQASLRQVVLDVGALDAELSGAGGAALGGFTRPGSRSISASLEAMGGTDLQTGAITVSGPVVRDTANFAFGVSFSRLRPERPAAWVNDTVGGSFSGIARDSFQVDLAPYLVPYVPEATQLAAFGRFDWLVAARHQLGVRASVGRTSLTSPDLAPRDAPSIGSTFDARDLSVAAALTSVIADRIGSELRVTVDNGNRELEGPALPRTYLADAGMSAGTSDVMPGRFTRTTFRLSETLHFRLPIGALKAGLDLSSSSHDHTFGDQRSGVFYFSDTTGLATGTGVFRQTVGTLPIAQFRTTTVGGFFQALLNLTPELELRGGVRFDSEKLPSSDIVLDQTWRNLTGIDNTAIPGTRSVTQPRFAFTWTPGVRRRWQLNAEAGIEAAPTDPGLLAEILTRASGVSVRRGFGAIGPWPTVPDSTEAPVRGRTLSLIGPEYAAPRTGRVAANLSGAIGSMLLRVQGLYRHTDFLPLRRDLNLAGAATARDQYGRPLHGSLTKVGSLLVADPATNRRFSAYDEVAAIDPAGYSDYYGVTLGLERSVGRGLDLMASYTYSRTTDNWFGARESSTEAQLAPFADSTGLSAWADGRSDFDVPHRLVLGAEVRLRGALAPRLAVLYRYRSGYPYTPGFRDGVDANGDGSARNDPAFVTDTVTGAANVIASASCLRSQIGRLAERNSCREDAASSLDLRLAFRLMSNERRSLEVIADVLGAVRSGTDIADRALYLVDPASPLTTNPTTRVTSVPLVANPNFGKPLLRRSPGALWRVGLRLGL